MSEERISAGRVDEERRSRAGRRSEDVQARLLWAVFDRALDAMVVADDSCVVRVVNDAATELFGLERERLAGRRLSSLSPDGPRVELAWTELLERGSLTGEWAFARADGSRRHVEFAASASVAPALHLAIMRDVTERRAESRALRASERRLRTIAESLEEGLLLVGFDGTLEWANSRFYELTGYAPEELRGRNMISLLHPSERHASTLERLDRRRRGITERYETDLIRKNLERLPVRITAMPIRDDAGRPVASLGAFVDLTDERRRDVERQAHALAIEQAERMASLGRFARGIAHDFNNVLTAITGNASLLCDAQDACEIGQSADAIARAAEHGRNLTQRLLAFAGKREVHPEPISLNDVLSELQPLVRSATGAGIGLELALDPDAGAVLAERTQLERVVLNLAVNARDAMPAGGTLTIATRASLPGQEPRLVLRVSDTGVGMDEHAIQHAFEPFFTTKPAGEGSGLGLSVVYGAVEQLGGTIALESAVGRGTAFEISLPVASERAAAVASAGPAGRSSS